MTFNSFLVIIMALLSIYLSMKKKPNIKELFGPTLDDNVALNNTITVQAKFKLCPEQDLILNKIMECLTHAKLMYFNYLIYSTKMNKFMKEHALYITKEVKVKDKVTGLTSSNSVTSLESFKVVFCRFYGLSSRQFNSIDFVIKGLIKANKTLMKDRLINFNDQLDRKLAKQKKLVGDLHLLSISDGFKTKKQDLISSHNKKKTALIKLKEEIEKKQEAIIRLENNIKTDKISVCFGDRKILNRLSSLFNDSNYDHGKYKHLTNDARKSYHTAYRKLWNDSRFNQFFLLGSKDENNGNASCVFSKQSESLYSVKISIPQCVRDELNLTQKYLVINNINFKHNEKEILNSFALNEQRKQKETEFTQKLKDKDPSLFDDKGEAISKADYLADEGVAISFRFIKDTFADPKRVSSSWRILTSMDETKHQKAIVSKATGVIAIDTNVDHFAVAELNSQRELKKAFNLYFGFTDSEQNSNKTLRKEAILKSAKEIIKYAIETQKPIVIERLDFKTKRAVLKEENTLFGDTAKRRNRILSSFAYSLMIETIKTLAYRNGIAVYEVNPAFTSQIGWLKYAKKYGISRHMAAAYVIGRRTYAIEELFDRNEQVIVKNQIGAVPLLVDRDDCKTYFEYCSKNLRNFLKRQVHESRGKLNSTQVSSGSVITI